jgi:hypothetical protein
MNKLPEEIRYDDLRLELDRAEKHLIQKREFWMKVWNEALTPFIAWMEWKENAPVRIAAYESLRKLEQKTAEAFKAFELANKTSKKRKTRPETAE